MGLVIEEEMDPLFETAALLYYSYGEEKRRGRAAAELKKLGVVGEIFYQKYFNVVNRYTRYFKRYMQITDGGEFFFDFQEEDFFLLMLVLLVERREWMEGLEAVPESEIRSLTAFLIKNGCICTKKPHKGNMPKIDNETEIIGFLKSLELAEGLKWHLMEFLMQPKYYLNSFYAAIKANLRAYEKAAEVVSKPLTDFITRYHTYIGTQTEKLSEVYCAGSSVYPSLISPIGQVASFGRGYQGIFNEFLNRKNRNLNEVKDSLTQKMKALGDRSKLDILCALKERPQYNLELASTLNLSTSTVSHHMRVLFSCGLVEVEKKDGKVYYCVNDDIVDEIAAEFRQVLNEQG